MEYIIFKSTCVYRIVCVGYPPKKTTTFTQQFYKYSRKV